MKKIIDLICKILFLYLIANVFFVCVMEAFKYPKSMVILLLFCTYGILNEEGYVAKLLDKFKKL